MLSELSQELRQSAATSGRAPSSTFPRANESDRLRSLFDLWSEIRALDHTIRAIASHPYAKKSHRENAQRPEGLPVARHATAQSPRDRENPFARHASL